MILFTPNLWISSVSASRAYVVMPFDCTTFGATHSDFACFLKDWQRGFVVAEEQVVGADRLECCRLGRLD
eukprot:15261430-Heterocapsa_arctica.AAC.1